MKSGIVLYYKENSDLYVLIGKTGLYLSEQYKKIDIDIIENIEEIEKIITKENFKENLNNILKITKNRYKEKDIKIAKDKIIDKITNYYKEIFKILVLTFRSSTTIPKGGVEDEDKNTLESALRELKEETNIDFLDEKKIKPLISKSKKEYYYKYELDEKEIEEVKNTITKFNTNIEGELFNLKFLNIEELKRENLNNFTKHTLESFENSLKDFPESVKKLNPKASDFVPRNFKNNY